MLCCGASNPYEGDRALSQPQRHGRKPWRCVRVIVLLLHAIFIGAVFLLDPALQNQIRQGKWYMISYRVLVLLTLGQYLYTAKSSPGYVVDMLRAGSGMHAFLVRMIVINYPPLHDCDKCVLQFDHHCTWLGTCIGKGNHCRFWWYIFGQAILAGWTVALYIQFLHLDMDKSWLKGLTGLILLVPLIIIFIVLVILVMLHTRKIKIHCQLKLRTRSKSLEMPWLNG